MSEPFKIIYDKSRFPKRQRRADGTWGCRGCGGVIPPHRQTWCSKPCATKYDPMKVLFEVKKRDKDICCQCGVQCRSSGGYQHTWLIAQAEHWMQHGEELTFSKWRELYPRPPKPNYDHIVPFSEGGLTVLENMRTLCEPCHKARTKHWHGERAAKRKTVNQPELL